VQGEAEVLEVGRRGARDVRPDLVVVVRLLAEGRDVDHADTGVDRAGAQVRQRLPRRAEHGQPGREQPGMDLAVPVDEVGADDPVDRGSEGQREHGGGVGRQAGRQVRIDHDRAAFHSLSGHRAPP